MNARRSTLVAIVSYNSSDLVGSLLNSLRDEPVDRILILDNNSAKSERESLEVIARNHERATVVYGDSNLGFGGGVNRALALLDPRDDDIVWVLNPDTTVASGSTALMAASLSEFDIISPAIISGSEDDPRIWYRGGTISASTGTVRHTGQGEHPSPEGRPFRTEFITGAAPMFTGATWRCTGGFRSELFLYWEDVDWSLRSSGLGLRLGVVPAAVVWHLVGGSGDTASGKSPTYYHYMQRNRLLVLGAHGHRTAALILGRGSWETARLLFRPLKERSERFPKFVAGLRGLIAGTRHGPMATPGA